MKVSSSRCFSLLCLLLSLVETAAWGFNFSFGNMLFAMNLCHIPGPKLCHINCKAPLQSLEVKAYCNNQCEISDSERRLNESFTWSTAACDSMNSASKAYEKCMAGAVDCDEYSAEYVEADADAVYGGDESNIGNGTVSSSRMSFLPYIIAAAMATMFVGLYIWKKKRDEKTLANEELLADDSFHGSVAKRISNTTSGKSVSALNTSGTKTSFVKTTGYALA